jgi:electron transfer flavoprotein beta subunit
MNIIVCLKQIADLQQIRIKKDTREPVLEGLPVLFGDMDKNALEEGIRLVEKHGGKVMALALGSPKLRETIKEALAMGADEAALLIDAAFEGTDSMGVALALAKAIERLGEYDLVLMGEGSADNYSGQVVSRVAEILGLPQITCVRELKVEGGKVKAVRDMEEAYEVVEAALPVVVSVTSEINQPRLASLIQILRAAKKPVQEWSASDLGLSGKVGKEAVGVETLSNLAPVQERKMAIFEGPEMVDQLLEVLLKEGLLVGR